MTENTPEGQSSKEKARGDKRESSISESFIYQQRKYKVSDIVEGTLREVNFQHTGW